MDELREMWAEDRVIAAQCHRRVNALVSHYEDLRTRLMTLDPAAN